MELSVIIVNYNVKYFLEQCLYSVQKAIGDMDAEVFVVDNNSVDGSEAMVRKNFPWVNLIINKKNVGFSVANNQAIKSAKGRYILLLNPDTVIEESTLGKCKDFMELHPEAGAMGPKMIDGKGRFLPESKRGLPTPPVAFYKISGLARIFPRSERFGKYYLGHTDPEVTQEVEVLTGAFMMIRNDVIQEIGGLDEQFFMYGEDIDLSYRIRKKGYRLFYFPETTIIHYKGESTRKGSLNYVLLFYKAMRIFTSKHFSSRQVWLYNLFINVAISLRATLSLVKRMLVLIIPVILEFTAGFLGLRVVARWWGAFYFQSADYYSNGYLTIVIPIYVMVWLSAVFLVGGYRRPFQLKRIVLGVFLGTSVILIVYAVLPEHFRFSRILIVLGTVWMLFEIILLRTFLSFTGEKTYRLDLKKKHRIVVIGSEAESQRAKSLLDLSHIHVTETVYVYPGELLPSEFFSGTLNQLREIIRVYAINEVIFCAKDISSQVIIEQMKQLIHSGVHFKIASPESKSLIGSNSSDSSGDIYVVNMDSV